MAATQSLKDKLDKVEARIAAACEAANRPRHEVKLIAVTKYAAPEQVREAVALGLGDLGENRVQQMAERAPMIHEYHARRQQAGGDVVASPYGVRWHMVGRLQRNKVKQLLPHCELIHSVDSLRLAEEIDEQAGRLGKTQAVLIQVNCSEEEQKGGVAVGAAPHLGEAVADLPHVKLLGLMTMAAHDAGEAARFQFGRLREIFAEMKFNRVAGDDLRHLSMGMSGDLEAAIAEGATLVRIGSDLFGGPEPDQHEPDEA